MNVSVKTYVDYMYINSAELLADPTELLPIPTVDYIQGMHMMS